MSNFSSEDEFDAFSDSFEGVDWDNVPDLDGEDLSTPPEAPPTTSTVSTSIDNPVHLVTPPRRPASTSSSSSYDFDDVDEDFLTQVDRIEELYNTRNAGPSTLPASSSSLNTTNLPLSDETLSSRPVKRRLSPGNSPNHTPFKKPKHISDVLSNSKEKHRKKSEVDEVREMLDRYEDDLTCPICCDLFAAAHLTNPCGHTCCGSCLWSWVSKNKRKPTCVICRAPLVAATPMIPNFSVDAAVQRHIEELIQRRIDGWEAEGQKVLAWTKRKEVWKSEAVKRSAKPQPYLAPVTPAHWEFLDSYEFHELIDDGYH